MHVLGMNNDLWDKVCELGSERVWISCLFLEILLWIAASRAQYRALQMLKVAGSSKRID